METALAVFVACVAIGLVVVLLGLFAVEARTWFKDRRAGYYGGDDDDSHPDAIPLVEDDNDDEYDGGDTTDARDESARPHTGWDAHARVLDGGGRRLRIVHRHAVPPLRDVSDDGSEPMRCSRAESVASSMAVTGPCEGQEVACDDDDIPPPQRGA